MQESSLEQWARRDSNIGVLLLIMLALALIIANSPFYPFYESVIDMPIIFELGRLSLGKPALLWINEGLMAIFFLYLTLEIKRECFADNLCFRKHYLLPILAAIGGIMFPVLIYLAFNYSNGTLAGWPIPTTTDIAFVLGVLGLLGKKRIPYQLKLFLISVSIVDDILAILIIAIFYSKRLNFDSLIMATLILVLMLIFKRARITSAGLYLFLGGWMWIVVVESGIHATLAGIITALFIPLNDRERPDYSPLNELEGSLHAWVFLLILPIFVFANGGVVWQETDLPLLSSVVPVGIAFGLCFGKTIGVFLFSLIGVKGFRANMPEHCSWRHMLGGSALTGIGFTMSLFFTTLAFYETPYENMARQGVLLGSLLSCLFGVMLLLKKVHHGIKTR